MPALCQCGKPLILAARPDMHNEPHWVCQGCWKSNWSCTCENSIAIAALEDPTPVEYAKVKLAMDQISHAAKRYGLLLVVDMNGNYDLEADSLEPRK